MKTIKIMATKFFQFLIKQSLRILLRANEDKDKEIEYLNNSKILNKILGNTKSYKFEGLSIDST